MPFTSSTVQRMALLIWTVCLLLVLAQVARAESKEGAATNRLESEQGQFLGNGYHPTHIVNLRYQALGVLINSHTLEADIAVAPRWTVGPIANYSHISGSTFGLDSNVSVDGSYFGLATHYFLSHESDQEGLYLKGYGASRSVTAKVQNGVHGPLEKSGQGLMLGLVVAYQWVWDRFNMHLGIGAETHNYPDKFTYTRVNDSEDFKAEQQSSGIAPTADFTVGILL